MSSRGSGETKGLFDCTAERGTTLPNEQAQSREISLCSGCVVAPAARLAQPAFALRGPAAQCSHSSIQNTFCSFEWSLCFRRWSGIVVGRTGKRSSADFQIFTRFSILHLSSF